MHTQIVLCPGLNDGAALEKTVNDLYQFNKHIISLAIVPVGLTDHRFGLYELRKVDPVYANSLLTTVEKWQKQFKAEIGRSFVYCSDEFHIVAGREVPDAEYYDGFPQTENGVGIVRSFLMEFDRQSVTFPKRLASKKKLTLATAELPADVLRRAIAPTLQQVNNLEVNVEVVHNVLYGRSVTVAGLLSGKCLVSSLKGKDLGDLVLLPPDIVNNDALFLDDMTVPQLEHSLGAPVMIFEGRWNDVFNRLTKRRQDTRLATT
jgi:putative radical SAM enzyme (TIGR03279 family)